MARRRRSRARKLRGRKAKRLGPMTRLPRFLRLGMSPAAGFVTVLGIGVLIGIGVSYHVLELRLEEHREVVETQTALSSAVSKRAEKPKPAAVPAALPVLAPPVPLERSPFAQPRLVQRPDMPVGTDPSGGQAASRFARTIHTPSPSFPEQVVLTIPSPRHPTTAAQPAWRRYAVRAEVTEGHPLIAILIDDAGLNRRNTARLVDLRGPLTFAFMTYADNLQKQSAAARTHGHELMLHMPMEPLDHAQNAGPNALETELDAAELHRRLLWGLDRLDGYVGINNHMGSRFTAWEPGMSMVMEELKRRGLLFVDSRTIADSVGDRMAERYSVPHADRDVFLDNDEDGAAVTERLADLEAVARKHGMAIGIGHPHDGTIAALVEWLPTMAQKGFVLVPVSTIVERRMEGEARTATTATVPPS
jgi:polysaccharide deacetylase 2 family uncharacterized protein YibQ